MIVRVEHPQQPGVQVFVPLHYDRDAGAWRALVESGAYFYQEADAARMCLERVLTSWKTIAAESAVLRALCEHPRFQFDEDGIDDKMIRVHARSIEERVRRIDHELYRLLSEPEEHENIICEGERLQVDEITGALPSLEHLGTTLVDEASSLDFRTPDDLFPRLVALALQIANRMSERARVTRKGLASGVAWLIHEGAAAVDHLARSHIESITMDIGEDETLERDASGASMHQGGSSD